MGWEGVATCRHLLGARLASSAPGHPAAAPGCDVVAGHTAECGDRPAAQRWTAGPSWRAARFKLDHAVPAAETVPAGRGPSQVERGVGSGPGCSPAAGEMPALRPQARRLRPARRAGGGGIPAPRRASSSWWSRALGGRWTIPVSSTEKWGCRARACAALVRVGSLGDPAAG